jgi:hypothetical protein
MYDDSATWTVQALGSCPMTRGHRKAFQPLMKVIVAIAAKKFSEGIRKRTAATPVARYRPVLLMRPPRRAPAGSVALPRSGAVVVTWTPHPFRSP